MEGINDLKRLGDAAYGQARYLDALENYNLAFEIIKNEDDQTVIDVCTRSALHSNRCICYIKLDRIQEAWKDAQAALFLRPRWPKANLRCAQCQELQGAFKEAITYYQRAAELDNNLSDEVLNPINALRAKLSQQLCHAIMLPPSSHVSKNNTSLNHSPSSPIYYASISPQSIQIGPKSTYILAAAYGDGAIRLWCPTTGTLLQTLNIHSQAVTTLAWSSDGAMIASGSLDMTSSIWKLVKVEDNNKQGEAEIRQKFQLFSILKGHSGRVSAVKFAPLVEDNEIKEQDNDDGYVVNQLMVTASTDLTIKIWKISNDIFSKIDDDGSCSSSPPFQNAECLYTLGGHSSLVSDIDIDPIYHKILVSASGDAQFKLWNITGKSTSKESNSDHLLENVAWESGPVVLCGFLPSQQMPLLLTAHAQLARQEGRILLWDVLEKKDGWVDGKLVAPAWSLDGFVGRPTSWDACFLGKIENKNQDEAQGEKSQSLLLAVACSDGRVTVWEIINEDTRPLELFSFEIEKYGGYKSKLEMPPWHVAALAQQQSPQNAFKIKFSPQGQFLAVTGGDTNQNIYIWSIQHGALCTLTGHSARIRAIEWSQDGNYLFSASEDGAVRKWKVETEEELVL